MSFTSTYRPTTMEEVVGQSGAVNQLGGELSKVYLLEGKSGSGKTTLARIKGKEINAEVLEVDTTNIGKDEILGLKEATFSAPMFNDYRMIILDEVHNLSKQAFDALLKVLEDGPKHTVWVMCTTEIHKVPDTIKNRSRVVNVKAIPKQDIRDYMQTIMVEEEVDVPDAVLDDIARFANGSMRLALTTLETYIETGELNVPMTQQDAIKIIKAVYSKDFDTIAKMSDNLENQDIFELIKLISDFMIFMSIVKTNGMTTEEVLETYTDIPVVLLGDLRDMQTAIFYTLKHPGDQVAPKTCDTLYGLLDALMRQYNNFTDNRYNVKGVLTWYAHKVNIYG